MLTLNKAQINYITRSHFFYKLARFLDERSKHQKLHDKLRDNIYIESLWTPIYNKFIEDMEYLLALKLSFALVCECEGINVENAFVKLSQLTEPEFAMKSFFEDRGYLRFSEFDTE